MNDLKGIELKTMKVQKEMLIGICAASYKDEQDLECVENRVKWHISQEMEGRKKKDVNRNQH